MIDIYHHILLTLPAIAFGIFVAYRVEAAERLEFEARVAK